MPVLNIGHGAHEPSDCLMYPATQSAHASPVVLAGHMMQVPFDWRL
jgi:hypothetical protein